MPKVKPPTRPLPADHGPVRISTMNRHRQVSGRTQWYWRARKKGERVDVWSGWATREEAQATVAALVAKGLPSSRPEAAPKIVTVADLLNAWVAAEFARVGTSLAQGTAEAYRNRAQHLVAWIPDVRLDQLSVPVLERYRDDRLAENQKRSERLGRDGNGWTTVAAEVNALAIAWGWGRERGFVPPRDPPNVKVADGGRTYNGETPDSDALGRALASIEGEDRIAFHLLASTGARKGEIVAARRRDLDPRTGELTMGVQVGAKKTGRRVFPLPESVFSALRDRCDGTDAPLLVWPGSQAAAARRQRIDRIVTAAAKAAGVPRFTPHGLRRYVSNALLDANVNVRDAAALLGHTPAVMLQRYAQATDARRASAVSKANLGSFAARGAVIEGPWKSASGTGSGHSDEE